MIMLSGCISNDIILRRDCTEMQRKNQNQRIEDMTDFLYCRLLRRVGIYNKFHATNLRMVFTLVS